MRENAIANKKMALRSSPMTVAIEEDGDCGVTVSERTPLKPSTCSLPISTHKSSLGSASGGALSAMASTSSAPTPLQPPISAGVTPTPSLSTALTSTSTVSVPGKRAVVATALPERLVHHRRLKKYASETSFTVDIPTSTDTNSDNTASPPVHDAKSHSRQFHVRAVSGQNTRFASNGGNTVVTKLNRRRQDSDDASNSFGSETTVASGTVTPVSKRNLRMKMRRPKSTGNMGVPTIVSNNNHCGNHIHPASEGLSGTTNAYDPSYTSATVHSFDSNQPLNPADMEHERRPSNFYLFEDDSTHEFDDEVTGEYY